MNYEDYSELYCDRCGELLDSKDITSNQWGAIVFISATKNNSNVNWLVTTQKKRRYLCTRCFEVITELVDKETNGGHNEHSV